MTKIPTQQHRVMIEGTTMRERQSLSKEALHSLRGTEGSGLLPHARMNEESPCEADSDGTSVTASSSNEAPMAGSPFNFGFLMGEEIASEATSASGDSRLSFLSVCTKTSGCCGAKLSEIPAGATSGSLS